MNNKLYAKVMTTAALLSAVALPAQAATTFTDIEGSYAKDAILELVNAGILNGTGNGAFNPTGKIERQDFAIILARALGLDSGQAPSSATFTDVPTDHYAFSAVEAAVQAGLINGYGNGLFGNGQNLSRQDMAVIFVRALGIDATGKASELEFSDANAIADYAKDAVAAAVELGLLSGNGDGTFNPSGNAERQAVAEVASKFLKTAETIKQENTETAPPSQEPQKPPAEPDKPVTAPPASTPSSPNPSPGSGSNGGGNSQPDTIAPAVTLVSTSPLSIGQVLVAKSNEAGYIYLVPASSTPLTKSALDALVTEGVARKTIASANISVDIATSELAAGAYKVYAVDSAGNVSVASAEIVLTVQEQAFELSLVEGATFWLNSKLTTDQNVTLSASNPASYDYNKQNIKSLLQIKRGATLEEISYNSGEGNFSVNDPATSTEIATLTVDSTSDLVIVSPSQFGVVISPAEGLEAGDDVALTFTLWENDTKVGSIDMPITLDETPPTVTGSTYSADGVIAITFSEDIAPVSGSIGIDLFYSATGTIDNLTNLDEFSGAYTTEMPNRRELRILLSPEWQAINAPQNPGRFYILTPGGIKDYSNNPLLLSVEGQYIDVP